MNQLKQERFEALDIFRGMTIGLMIVVNTPGSWSATFPPLLHAPWDGFSPTDLVFPSFLFAVGNAMAFSSRKWDSKSQGQVLGKVFKRFLILFGIGFLLYWFPFFEMGEEGLRLSPFSETRVFGVLQRIALCYLIGALLIYWLNWKQLVWVSAAVLLGYWGILHAFGDLTLEGNAARRLDLWLLGPDHLYKGEGIPFDPEGLLSTLPAVVNVIAGYLLGKFLISRPLNYESLANVLIVASLILFAGYLWDMTFPYNKKIWTSSYVLLTVGLDMVVVAVIIFARDIGDRNVNFHFFQVFGMNPLFIYILSQFLVILMFMITIGDQSLYGWIYENAFAWIGKYWGSLAFALVYMFINWLVAKFLWNRGIVIKV